ncbi:MAG: glycosyltransferase [Candidatus Aenigmatarchaeota archaeon]
MKVVQIIPRLDLGGTERGVIDLVRYFKNSEIVNIVISGGGRLVKELENLGITHYKLGVYKKSPFSLFLIPKLRKIFLKENVNIIHARSRVPAWLAFFSSRRSNISFITTIHGLYKNKFFGEVMAWGKFVICPSDTVARYMIENYKVPLEKIVIVPRWVDPQVFKFIPYRERKNSNVILSIGRISPTKGYEYLIEAFKKVLRFNPYLKLKIVGAPESSKVGYFNFLNKLVKRFSLEHNVEFIGFSYKVEDFLKEARVLVATSVSSESFGRVIIEAFSSGVPVIATEVSGFKDIVGKDGFLIEPRNSEVIACALLKILNEDNLSLIEEMTKNARKRVEKFYSLDKCLEEKRKLYIKTLKFKRILVIKISSLGDLILVFPSLKELKENFSEGKIFLLTLKKYLPLLRNCPYIDEVITLEDNYKRFKKILEISKKLRRYSFDYIIDFQNNRASHIMSFLSFPNYSFGYSTRFGFLLTNPIKVNYSDDPLTSQERILKLLGIKLKEKKLLFWDIEKDTSLLSEGDFIGINIYSSKKWESKNWPIKHIMNLIEMIYKKLPNFRIVLLGDEETKKIAEEIEKYIYPRPYNLCGKTSLYNLPSVIKKLKVLITPDTATMHLACSLNIPTIALFGPTDPIRHTIKCENLYIFFKKLPCSFCYKNICKNKIKNLCMENITPQEVFLKIKEILFK